MTRGSSSVLCLSLLIASCGGAHRAGEESEEEAIEAFAGARFGMSLDEALSEYPHSLFNSASIAECYGEVSGDGCTLYADTDTNAVFLRRAGVPYGLTLAFDPLDKLREVTLTYDQRSTKFDEKKCLDVLVRTNGWMTEQFGPGRPNRNIVGDPNFSTFEVKSPEFESVSIRRDTDGSAVGNLVYNKGMEDQNANLFFTVLPSVGVCFVHVNIENAPAADDRSAEKP